ncbi:hypothetical protein NOR51B_921 [Luminiphilus syltensis NOR5-1B]|uniref:Uncharacterized protein n=2 Tax=Luminiphilus TaxID=1341118 RepID=B8KT73_9GAMM|nr:hypothetical protein NOR51B_921 [Luminiphilus syltensis NOR5-1B]
MRNLMVALLFSGVVVAPTRPADLGTIIAGAAFAALLTILYHAADLLIANRQRMQGLY